MARTLATSSAGSAVDRRRSEILRTPERAANLDDQSVRVHAPLV